MTLALIFLAGLFLGGLIGVTAMSILVAGSYDDHAAVGEETP